MSSSRQTPIQIHIPSSLQKYTIPLANYLAAHPPYNNLVVSAFIFDSPIQNKASDSNRPARLLIVQRAAHERSFANLWEVPGGSSDAEDPTILHSLAREVFEETGLRLTRFVRQVGDVVEFQTGKGERRKYWAKLNFEIEVAEVDVHVDGLAVTRDGGAEPGRSGQGEGNKVNDGLEGNIAVTIDPQEHQGFAWATAEDVTSGRYPMATPAQGDLILESLRAADEIQGDK